MIEVLGTPKKIGLIVGAGLSCEAGLPASEMLPAMILGGGRWEGKPQEQLTAKLVEFWREAFGCGPGGAPSLADHFTALDLAANSGHQLGPNWPPRTLRALRRLTIWRLFKILSEPGDGNVVPSLLARLGSGGQEPAVIVSLNWDLVLERALKAVRREFEYRLSGRARKDGPVPLMKPHGSMNWRYCDSCRRLDYDSVNLEPEFSPFLTSEVFDALGVTIGPDVHPESHECTNCRCPLSARVGTFTYRKDYALGPFQQVWYEAGQALARCERWLFIGCSMPAADFEFRHLLKTAQMARPQGARQPEASVVLKGDCGAAERYREFFGRNLRDQSQAGLENWVRLDFENWLRRPPE